jgi:hypothetical protein
MHPPSDFPPHPLAPQPSTGGFASFDAPAAAAAAARAAAERRQRLLNAAETSSSSGGEEEGEVRTGGDDPPKQKAPRAARAKLPKRDKRERGKRKKRSRRSRSRTRSPPPAPAPPPPALTFTPPPASEPTRTDDARQWLSYAAHFPAGSRRAAILAAAARDNPGDARLAAAGLAASPTATEADWEAAIAAFPCDADLRTAARAAARRSPTFHTAAADAALRADAASLHACGDQEGTIDAIVSMVAADAAAGRHARAAARAGAALESAWLMPGDPSLDSLRRYWESGTPLAIEGGPGWAAWVAAGEPAGGASRPPPLPPALDAADPLVRAVEARLDAGLALLDASGLSASIGARWAAASAVADARAGGRLDAFDDVAPACPPLTCPTARAHLAARLLGVLGVPVAAAAPGGAARRDAARAAAPADADAARESLVAVPPRPTDPDRAPWCLASAARHGAVRGLMATLLAGSPLGDDARFAGAHLALAAARSVDDADPTPHWARARKAARSLLAVRRGSVGAARALAALQAATGDAASARVALAAAAGAAGDLAAAVDLADLEARAGDARAALAVIVAAATPGAPPLPPAPADIPLPAIQAATSLLDAAVATAAASAAAVGRWPPSGLAAVAARAVIAEWGVGGSPEAACDVLDAAVAWLPPSARASCATGLALLACRARAAARCDSSDRLLAAASDWAAAGGGAPAAAALARADPTGAALAAELVARPDPRCVAVALRIWPGTPPGALLALPPPADAALARHPDSPALFLLAADAAPNDAARSDVLTRAVAAAPWCAPLWRALVASRAPAAADSRRALGAAEGRGLVFGVAVEEVRLQAAWEAGRGAA